MNCFFGRQVQIKRILKILKQEKNLVLQGKFGVGKTRLIRHIALHYRDERAFLFTDFEKSPARMANELLHQVAKTPSPTRSPGYVRYRAAKGKLIDSCLKDPGRYIIVLDNIAGLTGPKLAFLRDLTREHHLSVIGVVERFLPDDDMLRLRAALIPCERVCLSNFRLKETLMFLKHFAGQYHFDWSESRIRALAKASHGYPLLLVERVNKERQSKTGA